MAYVARMLLIFLSTFIICQMLKSQGVVDVAIWAVTLVYGGIQYFIGFWAGKEAGD